jgi:solute carrier family 25 thiamine pyrophosphate transporter 19
MSVGVAGGLAAMSATFFTYPFDLIRTRMALQAHHSGIYQSFTTTFTHVLQTEGPSGFYKGVGPTLGQVIPYMGLSFHVHNRASEYLTDVIDNRGTVDFVAGGVAGVASKTTMMPFDVVRKRLQIQGSPYEVYAVKALPKYKGLLDCVQKMWATEGAFGFYRGLGLALMKSGPATATTFLVYGLLSRSHHT